MSKPLSTPLRTLSVLTLMFASCLLCSQAVPQRVTFYPEGKAIFSETLSLSLEAGKQSVPILTLPQASDVQLFPENNSWQKGVQFIGIKSPSLFEIPFLSHLNKSIWVKDVVSEKYVKATLKQVSPEEDLAVVQVGAELWQVPTSQLLLRELTTLCDFKKPTSYIAQLESTSIQTQKATLLYQLSGLRANMHYVWHLPQDTTRPVSLDALIDLENQSAVPLHQIQVNALFGATQRQADYAPRVMMSKAYASNMASDAAYESPSMQNVGELMMLRLNQAVDLDRQQKASYVWKSFSPKASFRYVYAPTQNGWWWQSQNARFEAPNQAVQYFLESNTFEDALPAGRFSMYQSDALGNDQLISEGQQGYHAVKEALRLPLGEAPNVRASKSQTSYVETPHTMSTSYEVLLKNSKATAVTVDVYEYPYEKWELMSSSMPAVKVEGVPVAFRAVVPAKGEAKISYTFRSPR
ncbi:MAG: hypothetical protein LW809_02825 [Vampirovibrionales bacterium]|nr:hypothetical protein [Vampirovibrionales bacterium]